MERFILASRILCRWARQWGVHPGLDPKYTFYVCPDGHRHVMKGNEPQTVVDPEKYAKLYPVKKGG